MFSYELSINNLGKLVAEADVDYLDQDSVEFKKGVFKKTYFTVYNVTDYSKRKIGEFCFDELTGCPEIVISCHTRMSVDKRHSTLSQPFRELKENLARDLGYSMMLATVNMENIPAVGNILKSKYRIVDTLRDRRVDNRHASSVGICIKKL